MQHAALKDVMRAVSTFEQRSQEDITPQLFGALLSQYVDVINVMLAGTGRAVTFDPKTRTVALNGGTASRGYGPVESIHAQSFTELFKTKLLETWGLNDAEQSALRTIAHTIEAGEKAGSGNMHTFSVQEYALEHTAITALQGTLDIVAARLHETKRLKDAVAPLKESVASLMARLDIQRGIPSSKGLKDIPFTQVAHSDYQKIQAALRAKGIQGEHADLHLGLILIDLVDSSHEKVQFSKSVPESADDEEEVEMQEIGEYRSVTDVETAATRYTEHIHDIIMQLEERSSVQTIGGFLVSDLEREEHSVERLFAAVQKLVERAPLPPDMQQQYEAVQAQVQAAQDRTSTDRVRFASARASLIAFRDTLNAHSERERKDKEADMQAQAALLRPIQVWARKLETALSQAYPQSDAAARHTGKEFSFLDDARAVLKDLQTIQRGVYPDTLALQKVLDADGISDTTAFEAHMSGLCEKVTKTVSAPHARIEKSEKAFEHLEHGILETETHHRVVFDRIDNRITFRIPTAIARVVQDTRLAEQLHSGSYASLAEAIRYANASLIIPESRIIGLEERASEQFVDDTVARLERISRAQEQVRAPYRSLRSKVTRVVAAILGGSFGMFVNIPDAPRKEPTHDVDVERDAKPMVQQDTAVPRVVERQPETRKGGITVTIPNVGELPERNITIGVPAPVFTFPKSIPQEIDAQYQQLSKAFTAPVTSEHGTYTLLPLLRTYMNSARALTPDERKATDWFTHAFTRYINELPEERIGQLTPGVRLQRGVIASTIPSKVGTTPVRLDFSAILKDAQFWKWFDTFYAKRKTTSLAQPGLTGVALSIDALTLKLKRDFKITE
jgi:hypothetical protein